MTPTEIARINRQTLIAIRRAKMIMGLSIALSVLAVAIAIKF